jgi:bacterioferritin-associated ferredoxin
MKKKLVCLCNMVTSAEIEAALSAGACTTEGIQNKTGAGTNCGKCLVEIDTMVDEFNRNRKPDPQQKFDF